MRRVPLKRVATIIAGQSPPSSEVVSFEGDGLPFLQGNAEFGIAHPIAIHRCDSAPKKCSTSDVLLSVRAPVGALNVADQPYGIGRGLCAVRPSPRTDERFLWWALNSLRHELDRNSVGSTYTAVTAEDVGALPVPEARESAQRAIADFLDAETARIDALIAKKLRLMELASLRVWYDFESTVAGLPVPRVPLRRCIGFITDGPFGSAFRAEDYSETGALVVRLGNIGFGEFKSADNVFIPFDLYSHFLRHRVSAGDLLIAGLGDASNHAGRACVAPDLGRAIVKGKCFCARVNDSMADGYYLALFLSSRLGAEAIGVEARGSTRTMINLEIVKAATLPLPRVEVQREIVERFRLQQLRTTKLVDALSTQVNLLTEHRQALITAAVTGEIGVPGARTS